MGRTRAAVAGGVNIMLAWRTSARICLLQALSTVGRCKSFDASGDGYGRGEGFTLSLLGYVWVHPLELHFSQDHPPGKYKHFIVLSSSHSLVVCALKV